MSKFELMEDKQTSELSDSWRADEIRFTRIKKILEALFSRVKEVKESDRPELVEKFLSLVNSPTSMSNKILLTATVNELMRPVRRLHYTKNFEISYLYWRSNFTEPASSTKLAKLTRKTKKHTHRKSPFMRGFRCFYAYEKHLVDRGAFHMFYFLRVQDF
jgi:hypothetical protein